MQNRLVRCIHFSLSTSRLPKSSKTQVEGQFILIPWPVFWVMSITDGIHKVNANSHFFVVEIERTSDV